MAVDLITETRNKLWLSEQRENKLEDNDRLVIIVTVQFNDVLHQRVEHMRVLNGTLQNNVNPSENFLADAFESITMPIQTKLVNKFPEKCVPSITRIIGAKAQPNCRSELIFEENFDGPRVNLTQWSHDIYIANFWDRSEEFVIYDEKGANVFINEDGHLNIFPTLNKNKNPIFLKERCTLVDCYPFDDVCKYHKNSFRPFAGPPAAYSARINTRKFFSFEYGKIDIRAKMSYGDWLIPYLMLQSNNDTCDNRRQFRIAFAKTHDINNSRIRSGLVSYIRDIKSKTFKRQQNMLVCRYDVLPDDNFHKYTLIWTDEEIKIYVDDKKCACWRNFDTLKGHFHIVLGLSAGGLLEFATEKKPWCDDDHKAAFAFRKSFENDCHNSKGKSCDRKFCSNNWNHDAILKIDYVRVFSV